MSQEEINLEDVIYEEIENWINERIEICPRKRSEYLQQIADHLNVCPRQVRRYCSGETDIPTNKLLLLCKYISSNNPIIHLNYEIGIEAFDPPKLEELDSFDVTEEIRKGLETIGGYLQTFSKEVQKTPNNNGLKNIRIRERQLIMQIRRCTRLYGLELENHIKNEEKKARDKRIKRQEKLRHKLEEEGQMRLLK